MAWLTPLLPVVSAFVLYLAGSHRGRLFWTAAPAIVCLVTFLLAGSTVVNDWGTNYRWSDSVGLMLSVTPLSAVFIVTVPLVALPILTFAASHESKRGLARLMTLLLVFIGAMELLVLAADLLTLVIGWELVGACSWALIAHEWQHNENNEAANRAFLVTRLGDLGLFLAAFAAFSTTGSFDYTTLHGIDGFSSHVFAAGIVVAAASKSAQVPFSPWLFSAMAGPVSVSALLHAATMVAAGVFVLVRLHPMLESVNWFAPVAIAVGLVTAIAAGLVASAQLHAKKLLAASTSAHYGLMWIAVGAGFPAVAAVHFITHAIVKAALFLIAGIKGKSADSYDLRQMGSDSKPFVFLVATIIISLALAGMFPLGAAWSKEKIVTAAGHWHIWLLPLVMLASALCGVYAARFQVYTSRNHDKNTPVPSRGVEPVVVYVLAIITLVLSFLWWPPFANEAARQLAGDIPPFKPLDVTISLALIIVGGVIGTWIVKRNNIGESGLSRWTANWFGLPTLARTCIAVPLTAGSEKLASFDDRYDNWLCRSARGAGRTLPARLAETDDRIVDKGLLASAACGRWLSGAAATVGELLSDAIPEGLGLLSGKGGGLVRKLQSGMSHHYYTLTMAGIIIVACLLTLGVLL